MRSLSVRSSLVISGGCVALAGTFLPWLRTGERQRTSYDLSAVVRRLHVATGTVERWTVAVWPVVPFALLAAMVLLVSRRSAATRVFGAVVGCYVLVVCLVVWQTSLGMRIGVPVTVVGAVLLLSGVAVGDQVPV